MARKSEVDVRDVVRVIFSGIAAYVAVHLLLLPRLHEMGLGFPAYFYIGVGATMVVSVAFGVALRPRRTEDTTKDSAETGTIYAAE